jgi:oligosaccharide repeat unit polymerase
VLTLLVLLIVMAAPLCYRLLVDLSSTYSPHLILAAYAAAGDEYNQGDVRFRLFQQLATYAIILSMIAFYESERSRLRYAVVLAIALLMCLMTGNRTGMGLLMCSLLCLDWIKRGRIRWKVLAVMGTVVIVLFGAVAIAVGKGAARPDAPVTDNLAPVAQGFLVYASGGLIGFDELVRDPNLIPHNSQIYRIPLQTLDKFGLHYEMPNIHAQFVTVGPYALTQNVYTFYFTYMDWGFAGMMFLVAVVGFVVTVFYRKAVAGDPVSALVYGALSFGLVMTPYNENFFIGMSMLAKIYVCGWFFYRLPAKWRQFSQWLRHIAQRELVANADHL